MSLIGFSPQVTVNMSNIGKFENSKIRKAKPTLNIQDNRRPFSDYNLWLE